MKSKITSPRSKKLYTANNKIYCVLVVLLIVVITVILAIENRSIVWSETVNSILTGILSGLLSSVVVAWFIDLATCKRKNDHIEHLVSRDHESLKLWINDFFQSMSNCLQPQSIQTSRNIESLYDEFVEQIGRVDHAKVLIGDDDYYNGLVGLYVSINLIISTVDKLLSGEEKSYMLQKYSDLSSFLTLSKSMSDLRDNLFNNGNHRYDFIFVGICDFLSTILPFADFLNKKYSTAKQE